MTLTINNSVYKMNIINGIGLKGSFRGGEIWLFKKYWNRLKRNDGFMSLVMLVVVSVLFPLFLFYFVEINYLYGVKDQIQGYTDSAASAAVMQVNREKIKEGIIELDDQKAEEYAKKILASNLRLNEDLSVTEGSLIKEDPIVRIYPVMPSDLGGKTEYVTPEGFKFTITNPTVIVYTEAQPQGIFYNRFVTIKSVSAYQASFKKDEPLQISNTPIVSADGLVVRLNGVVNPLRFSEENPFPLEWSFSPVPMTAGGNIQISINSTGNNKLVSGDYILQIEGDSYLQTIYGTLTVDNDKHMSATIEIPENAPVGSKVYLSFQDVYINDGNQTREADALMNFPGREQIGFIESNIYKLFRIQKTYMNLN